MADAVDDRIESSPNRTNRERSVTFVTPAIRGDALPPSIRALMKSDLSDDFWGKLHFCPKNQISLMGSVFTEDKYFPIPIDGTQKFFMCYRPHVLWRAQTHLKEGSIGIDERYVIGCPSNKERTGCGKCISKCATIQNISCMAARVIAR